MASTDHFQLEIPSRGQYAGTWDIPINANFVAIDNILNDLRNNNLAASGNSNAVVGSTWYSSINNSLHVKTPSGFIKVSEHIHDGIDLPKVNLTDGAQVTGKLPGFMIDALTIDAGSIGGITKDQLFYIAGDGLAASGSKISLLESGIVPGTYNRITVDKYGRALFGTTVDSSGVDTSVLASLNGDATQVFNVKAPEHSSNAVPLSFMDARMAFKAGDRTQTFELNDPTKPTDGLNLQSGQRLFATKSHSHTSFAPTSHTHSEYATTTHLHPEILAMISTNHDTMYAKINGDSSVRFKVMEAVAGDEAVSKLQAENSFSPKSHSHTRSDITNFTHTHPEYLLSAGTVTMPGDYTCTGTLSAKDPTTGTEVATKGYVDGTISTYKTDYSLVDSSELATAIAGIDLTGGIDQTKFALKAGSETQTFKVGEAVDDFHAINKKQADAQLAKKDHTHDGVYSGVGHNHQGVLGSFSDVEVLKVKVTALETSTGGVTGIQNLKLAWTDVDPVYDPVLDEYQAVLVLGSEQVAVLAFAQSIYPTRALYTPYIESPTRIVIPSTTGNTLRLMYGYYSVV